MKGLAKRVFIGSGSSPRLHTAFDSILDVDLLRLSGLASENGMPAFGARGACGLKIWALQLGWERQILPEQARAARLGDERVCAWVCGCGGSVFVRAWVCVGACVRVVGG